MSELAWANGVEYRLVGPTGTTFGQHIVLTGPAENGTLVNTSFFQLTADGSALGAAIADYFGTNSAFAYAGGGVYEITYYLWYLKTTAGTVTYTITSTTAPVNLNASYVQSAVAGDGTVASAVTAGLKGSTSTAAALPATGSLTDAAEHQAIIRVNYVANASSGNVRLRCTESAGTITPRAYSYYTVRRLPVGNSGPFVA